ncbi:MAG: DHA2 family efflux MFS transporter permease subunit [Parvularculaceae bacterium]|nr:DHA2 family efflux MFS transporter permease subunit [Parvularculaceae bacterium]
MSATTGDAVPAPDRPSEAPRADARPETLDRAKLAVFGVMVFGMFMAVLDIQIVAASLPQIQASLSASSEEISWVQTAYLIAEVMMIPISGYLSRALSTRVIFVISAAGFAVASLGCALSWNIESLVVMRAVQGFIGGAMIPTVFATAFSAFPTRHQASLSAVIGLIVTAAPAVGPTLGGFITEHLSWHWLFFINVVPGAMIATTVWLFGHFDEPDHSLLRRIDFLAFGLMAVGLGFLEYVLEEGPREDWFDDPLIAVMAFTCVVSLTLFIWRSLATPQPLVDLNAFRNRNFLFSSLSAMVLGAALFGLVYILPLFLARVRGYSSLQIGETLFVTGASMFFAAPLAAILSRKFDPRLLCAGGFALAAISTTRFAAMTSEWGFSELLLPQVARGVGLMFCMAPINVIAFGTMSPLQVRSAAGLFSLMRNLGGAVGLAVINTMLTERVAFHARTLSDNLDPGAPLYIERSGRLAEALAASGASDGAAAASSILIEIVQREAAVLAFADMMRVLFWICVAGAVFLAFVGRPQAQGAAPAH